MGVEHIQDDFEPETSTDTILKHVSPAAKRQFTAMAPPDFSPIERQSRSASMNISNRSFKSPKATSKTPLNNSSYPNLSLKEIRMNSPKSSNRSMNNSPARSPMVKLALNNSRHLNNTKTPEITRKSPIIRQETPKLGKTQNLQEKIAKARKKLSITAEKLVEETLEETNKTEKHVEKMRNIIDDLDEDIDSPFFKMPLPPPPKPKVSDR